MNRRGDLPPASSCSAWSAEIAEDGAAALALWRAAPHAPPSVLLDLHMPVLDFGFGLASCDPRRRSRARPGAHRTFIAVTADALKGEDAPLLGCGHGRCSVLQTGVGRCARPRARTLDSGPPRGRRGFGRGLPARCSIRRRCAGLFGVGRRFAGVVQMLRRNRHAREVAALRGGSRTPLELAACAHRLKRSGAGGRGTFDRRAGGPRRGGCPRPATSRARGGLRSVAWMPLLAETLRVMRSVV